MLFGGWWDCLHYKHSRTCATTYNSSREPPVERVGGWSVVCVCTWIGQLCWTGRDNVCKYKHLVWMCVGLMLLGGFFILLNPACGVQSHVPIRILLKIVVNCTTRPYFSMTHAVKGKSAILQTDSNNQTQPCRQTLGRLSIHRSRAASGVLQQVLYCYSCYTPLRSYMPVFNTKTFVSHLYRVWSAICGDAMTLVAAHVPRFNVHTCNWWCVLCMIIEINRWFPLRSKNANIWSDDVCIK